MSKIAWYRVSLTVVLALCLSGRLSGQISLKNEGFTENFDSMGQDGTWPPDGWALYIIPGIDQTWQPSVGGILADQMSPELFGRPSIGLTAMLDPTMKNINGFNAATSDAPDDRALATSPTGIAGNVLELLLTNDTGRDLQSLSISYDIRRFTAGVGGDDELPGYWLFYSLDGGTTYVNVSDLNPDINSVPDTPGVTHIPIDITGAATYQIDLSATPLIAGSSINLCWVDDNGILPSPDQIIGLDNVVITVPAP